MSYMSRNNSATSLMGFSVHQPTIGAPLQFFPAMGSKQLDEMIDAYVTGAASISEKRAAVSMEFFEHSMVTGELFKFFMVYPSLGSTTESPTGSMLDSGYASNFTSPVMSERQWTQTSHAPSSSESKPRKPSNGKSAISTDFSHLPGMKIMTRDGKDVTNSASRGCKTKEQRDHAHLMRIIKACDACRKKKVRCDPSHKRSSGSSTAKASRKTKKATASSAAPSAPPPQLVLEPLEQPLDMSSFDLINMGTASFDSIMPESLVDPSTMDWDQFVQYDEEPTETIPYDYDFFLDPAGHFSPSSSNSFSSSQPITPAQTLSAQNTAVSTVEGDTQSLLPPYLNPGGEAGNDYADFNLYSPGSSTYLDDDPSLTKEVAAVPGPQYSDCTNYQRSLDSHRRDSTGHDPGFVTQLSVSVDADYQTRSLQQQRAPSPGEPNTPSYREIVDTKPTSSTDALYGGNRQIDQVPKWHVPDRPGELTPLPPTSASLSLDESLSPTQLDVASPGQSESRFASSSPSTGLRPIRLSTTTKQDQQNPAPVSTTSNVNLSTVSIDLVLRENVEISSIGSSSNERHSPTQSQSVSRIRAISHSTGLNRSQNQTFGNGTTTSIDAAAESFRLDKPLSLFSLRTIHRTRPTADAALAPSAAVPGQYISNAGDQSPQIASVTTSTFRSTSAPDSAKTSSQYTQPTLPPSILKTNLAVLSSDLLVSALGVMALHVLPFVLSIHVPSQGGTGPIKSEQGQNGSDTYNQHQPAIFTACLLVLVLLQASVTSMLSQWRLNKTDETKTTSSLTKPLPIAVARVAAWQQVTPCVDLLDLTTQPLSFVRRIPISVMNGIGSRYSQLPRTFSKISSDFGRRAFAQIQGRAIRVSGLQHMTSIAW
ncbi:uncharacterized protein F4822DRAFT_118972 [Hypoxylon trugodes]|uniref:uncharacterized protein n=1 Tax=Hypoxylon trugodes TaxID=326681 RepID=UPI00218DFB8F|nr:uncharacterized protein F4822DRAFT_118972 [Hypoxylon trugodes]KAI1392197.1 hypothetical protein F4822DRAFT_118972 [Hypoxylon trugodes]